MVRFDDPLEWITVVSGRLTVVKGLKRTNQNVSLGRTRHMIGL
jgi:hypothetical protein